jgi:hypothetical protein
MPDGANRQLRNISVYTKKRSAGNDDLPSCAPESVPNRRGPTGRLHACCMQLQSLAHPRRRADAACSARSEGRAEGEAPENVNLRAAAWAPVAERRKRPRSSRWL